MKKITLPLLMLFFVSGCGYLAGSTDNPLSAKDERRESRGSLSGEGGLKIFGGGDDDSSSGGSPIGVNAFLWRATLDTLSFVPLNSADPFGGVVITDWYEDPENQGERFKMTALILDRTLRADGIKMSVFRQIREENGEWRDAAVKPSTPRALENTILTRARELKVRQATK